MRSGKFVTLNKLKLSQGVQFSVEFFYRGDISTIDDLGDIIGLYDPNMITVLGLTRLGVDLQFTL